MVECTKNCGSSYYYISYINCSCAHIAAVFYYSVVIFILFVCAYRRCVYYSVKARIAIVIVTLSCVIVRAIRCNIIVIITIY